MIEELDRRIQGIRRVQVPRQGTHGGVRYSVGQKLTELREKARLQSYLRVAQWQSIGHRNRELRVRIPFLSNGI